MFHIINNDGGGTATKTHGLLQLWLSGLFRLCVKDSPNVCLAELTAESGWGGQWLKTSRISLDLLQMKDPKGS